MTDFGGPNPVGGPDSVEPGADRWRPGASSPPVVAGAAAVDADLATAGAVLLGWLRRGAARGRCSVAAAGDPIGRCRYR